MMLVALTRTPSPRLEHCHLTFIPRQPIDYTKALAQHREYEYILRGLQVEVLRLPEAHDLPDGVFVEDTAVIVDELAISAALALQSRQRETETTICAVARYRDVTLFVPPATFDGGDVIIAGRRVFVGLTRRTNHDAFEELRRVLSSCGYLVTSVFVHGCLHLKTGCTYLGRGTFIVNSDWVDPAQFAGLSGFRCLHVHEDEPFGANTLTVHDTVIVPASCPRTAAAITRAGFQTVAVDISEFEKAEAGVSCLSLLFPGDPPQSCENERVS